MAGDRLGKSYVEILYHRFIFVLTISGILADVDIVDPTGDELSIDAGRSFTLKCVADPGSLLHWFHDNHLLTPSSKVVITTSLDINDGRQTSLLTRFHVGSRETGSYECNDIRSDKRRRINVRMSERGYTSIPVEIIEPISKSLIVDLGSTFSLMCIGSPASTLTWFFDPEDKQMTDGIEGVTIQTSTDRDEVLVTSVLRLTSVTLGRQGSYSCRNQIDATDRDEVMVTVDGGSSRMSDVSGGSRRGRGTAKSANHSYASFPVTMKIGAETSLDCSFKHRQEEEEEEEEGKEEEEEEEEEEVEDRFVIEWMKNSHWLLLGHGEKYIVSWNSTQLTSNLRIRHTDRSDVGIYRCQLRRNSRRDKVLATITFNVSTAPCPVIGAPMYGRLDNCPQPPVFGDSCSFGCNHGYRLDDHRPISCERRADGRTHWTGRTPTCIVAMTQLVDTSSSDVERSVASSVSHVMLRARESLVLECIGTRTIWRKEGAVLRSGPKFSLNNRSLTIRNTDRWDVGVYECTSLRNLVTGRYSFNVTTLRCPPLSGVAGGVMIGCNNDSPVLGDSCVFQCAPGLQMAGSRTRSCELMGTNGFTYWTGEPANCIDAAQPLIGSTLGANIPFDQSRRVIWTVVCFSIAFGAIMNIHEVL